ncbi:GntR family transcriptional regulator [Scatolibacter rhodanostii]|uniref:GntR family transcriptional regulator n=1 Tax=Scatolibacter rhodanostii TaxID=2014781 RepID=UPI0013565B42|nr:GntR family transcriptional regulator [Scatolibacter rhodanostii]
MDHPARIIQSSTAEMVAQRIRDGIMSGQLKSGDKLKEVELSKSMSVSRTPVREAFRILQSEGFVIHNPRVGVVVASIEPEDVVHLYQVRAVLEELSAYNAASRIKQEHIDELRRINQKMLSCAENDPARAREYDLDFHIALARHAGNPILEEQLAIVHRKTHMILNFVPFQKKRIPYSCKEHDDIIAALEQHDEFAARKYMEIHFHKSTHSLKNKVIEYNLKKNDG